MRQQIIPISKGLFSSKKKSKAQILKDIRNIDKTNTNKEKNIDENFKFLNIINYFIRVGNIYKEYNIIDSSAYSKIDSLSNEYKSKYNIVVNRENISKQEQEKKYI